MKHWKPTTTRASTERGGPDPGSELVEVARKQGRFRRVRVAAARPCAPIPLVGGGAMVFGAGGYYCDYPPEPSGQHGHCGSAGSLAMAVAVADAGQIIRFSNY